MDRETFARCARDALEHLHNLPYLATSSLAEALGGEDRPLSGEALRRVLLDAIEQLKPAAGAREADWRQYRNLTLRYGQGQSREQVAQALSISTRQATRDHQQALETVIAYLWLRRGEGEAPHVGPPTGAGAAGTAAELPEAGLSEQAAAGDTGRADLGETIDGVLATLEAFAAERGVAFATSGVDTLPPVAVAPTLLRQAILNLLTYATEVAPESELLLAATDTPRGVTLRVRVRGHAAGADSGQADPRPSYGTSLSQNARGVGSDRAHQRSPVVQELLAAGRQILAAQGGSVELDAANPAVLLTLVLPPAQLRKVLVVDDNVDFVGLFRRYLRDQPYRLLQATSGPSALRLALELHPDAIVLDVMLPSQDGWDVLRELRRRPETQAIPVIVCSVLPERALALALGVSEFLAKPVTREALLAALERCCSVSATRPVPR